ncbi:MAG: hypothetical protein Q8L20_15715 [Gammaproteobacteria bacterium]|nr:hypothetical protein [Gammaproteobacteria bacterium]
MYFNCELNIRPTDHDNDMDVDRNMIAIFSTMPIEKTQPEMPPFAANFMLTIVGEYESLEEARQAFFEFYPEHRAAEDDDIVPLNEVFDGVVAVFKPGKFQPLGGEGSLIWINNNVQRDITAATSDDEIEQLWVSYQLQANQEGNELDERIAHVLLDYREDLREADA